MTPKKRLLSKLVDTALRGVPRAARRARCSSEEADPAALSPKRQRFRFVPFLRKKTLEIIAAIIHVEGLWLKKNMASSNLPRVSRHGLGIHRFRCGVSYSAISENFHLSMTWFGHEDCVALGALMQSGECNRMKRLSLVS